VIPGSVLITGAISATVFSPLLARESFSNVKRDSLSFRSCSSTEVLNCSTSWRYSSISKGRGSIEKNKEELDIAIEKTGGSTHL
jgi:hypothetical protein